MPDHSYGYGAECIRADLSPDRRIDLKPDNILVKVEDPTILEKDVLDEYCNPIPQKMAENRIIYLSRNNYGPLLRPTGLVQIADFGLSVSGKMEGTGCIQAEAYRAPEVILDAGYTYSADIWSLGVMVRSHKFSMVMTIR